MIAGGEDPKFIARRMIIFASEDVGNADPRALEVAVAAARAVEFVGLPGGAASTSRRPSPTWPGRRSRTLPTWPSTRRWATSASAATCGRRRTFATPRTRAPRKLGHGVGYVYPHDHPETPQQYLPDELVGRRYYPEDKP